MRSLLSIATLAAAATVGLPQGQQVQQADCELEVETSPTARSRMVTLLDGSAVHHIWGGVEATCGTKWLRADSAAYYQNRGVLELYHNVEYRDQSRTLLADSSTYYEAEGWVRSMGDVRLTDTSNGSTLKTSLLDYYPQTDYRPVERMFAPNRPHLVFYPQGSADSEPFEVDADRLHIYGDSSVAGSGNVVAVRGGLRAYSDSMDLNLGEGTLWLLGDAPRVEARDTELQGDTILILLVESKVREIQAWPAGEALSEELSLSAPSIRLFVDGEEITRAVAAAGDPERTGVVDSAGRAPWARSRSRDYVLTADSIDIRRPAGLLESVLAVGRARAQAVIPFIPGEELLGSDWLEGDTITGYFEAPDTLVSAAAGEEVELSRLVAASVEVGEARALYYMREEQVDEAEEGEGEGEAVQMLPAVNYVRGLRITLFLQGGEVSSALVVGPSTGLYLEPVPLATDGDSTLVPPDSGTVAADTLIAPADSILPAATDTLADTSSTRSQRR
jgi:lipopolysaccharide export system protein LptA